MIRPHPLEIHKPKRRPYRRHDADGAYNPHDYDGAGEGSEPIEVES